MRQTVDQEVGIKSPHLGLAHHVILLIVAILRHQRPHWRLDSATRHLPTVNEDKLLLVDDDQAGLTGYRSRPMTPLRPFEGIRPGGRVTVARVALGHTVA